MLYATDSTYIIAFTTTIYTGIIILILQMKILKLRGVNYFAWGHTMDVAFEPGLSGPKFHTLQSLHFFFTLLRETETWK